MPFVCSVCGEHHDQRLLDVRLALPHAIHLLDVDARTRRAWLADDFAVLDDERFFVRGLLELPIPGIDDRFAYGSWVEVSMQDFQELMRHWHDDEQFDAVECAIANELEPYRDTLGLYATLRATAPDKLPAIELADAAHDLVDAQRRGISVGRSDELAAVVLHR
ncbi:MAG TPA: DUF2199 domain-containing protein [Gaiellaceae bacterium]|jgi:hypothetical protein